MWKRRSKTLFIAGLALSGFIMIQMLAYGWHLLSGFELRHNVVQFCMNTARSLGLTSLIYLLNGLLLYTLLTMAALTGRQLWLARRARRELDGRRHARLSRRLTRRYGLAGRGITVIEQAAPAAFTMHFWRPQVVLSTGLIALLDEAELEAVIVHEQHHQRHGDPLKIFTLSLCASVLWYVPLLKWLLQHYKIAREVLADQAAVARQGSPAALGGALLKQDRGRGPGAFTYASFADTSINYRIRLILNPDTELALRPPFTLTMLSAQALIGLGAIYFLMLP